MSNSTQKQRLAKIIKFEIEEVSEGYIRPYISFAKPKHHLKLISFVEDMIPTQEETFTREEYPLIMIGFSNKLRQGFYVKKEFEAMFESLFKEFLLLEYERGKADARREVIDEIDLLLAMVQSTTEDTTHKEMLEMVGGIRKSLATLKEEIK